MPFPYTLFVILWTGAVLILIAVLVYPSFQNRALKVATDRFGKQLQQNPTLGEEFAQTLYKPVAWMDVDADLNNKNLPDRLRSLPNQVGNFLIHYRQWVSEDSYLLVTTVDYLRPYYNELRPWDTYSGTRVSYNLNFVVKFDAPKKQVVVLSDLYETLVDKNLRADFAQIIFKLFRL